jgi:soluble lytic murein transglycosylase-like protein
LGAALVALPSTHAKPAAKGRVTVTMGDFRAVPAHRAYDTLIEHAAAVHGIDPALIRAVMRAESAFNPLVVSRAGAQGLMQLMPELSGELGVIDPFDPAQNILAGARYLKWLLDLHKGNIDLAIASYNAGPGAVARYKEIPPYRETREYVKNVKQFLSDAREETNGD